MNQKKAIVLFSGGLDSTTCLALAAKRYGAKSVLALSLTYGQKHQKEILAAGELAEYYQVELKEVNLKQIFDGSSSSLLVHSDEDIPTGDYAGQLEQTGGDPVSTYVPFRNGLFLSVAAGIGYARGCEVIYYGAHMDDAAGSAYPDCSEAFLKAEDQAIYEGTGHKMHVEAPFIRYTKGQIVAEGIRLHVPYELTWSCYEGGEYPCGVCGTCVDRLKAFRDNGLTDPLLYS